MDKETVATILKNASMIFSAFGYVFSTWIWIYLCFHKTSELPGFAILISGAIGSSVGIFGLILVGCSHYLNRKQHGLRWPYLLNIVLILLPVLSAFTEMKF